MLQLNRQLWTLALLAAGVVAGVGSFMLQGTSGPAHAQVAASTLTTAQLTRLQRLGGRFSYVSGTSRDVTLRSILTATQALDASRARAARAQLDATLVPARRLQFSVENTPTKGTLLQVEEGGHRLSTPLTGTLQNVATVATGAKLSQELQNSTLVQVVENRGLRQERRFSLNAAGTTLTLDVRVTGNALSTPVQVQAIYQRL